MQLRCGKISIWSFCREAGDDGIRHCQRIPMISGLRLQVEGETDANVWNDFFRSMLTLLDGVPVQLEAAAELPVQRVVRPRSWCSCRSPCTGTRP